MDVDALRKVLLIGRVVFGLTAATVGIACFAEVVRHPELYPSHHGPLGGSKPHWVWYLGAFCVVGGLILLVPARRRGGGEPPRSA